MRLASGLSLFPFLMIWAGSAFAAETGAADLVAWLTPERLAAIMPGAERVEAAPGPPPAAVAHRAGAPLGYLFSTRAVVQSTGYSGKPLDVVAGLGLDGRITGAVLRAHQEPILVIGVAEADLAAFVERFRGLDIRQRVRVDGSSEADAVAIDGISGASVSSVVISDAVLRAARIVARAHGILPAPAGQAGRLDLDGFEPMAWPDLLDAGLFARLQLDNGTVAARFGETAEGRAPWGAPDDTFAELYAGLMTPALAGRNLLPERLYNRLMAERRPGEHFVLIASNGRYSFKGTDYVRSGVFDRIQIVQGANSMGLTADQHTRLDALAAAGAPEFREIGLFRLPAAAGFDPLAPWRLELLVRPPGSAADDAPQVIFALPYAPPARLVLPAAEAAAPEPEPAVDWLFEGGPPPLWAEMWQARAGRVAVLVVALVLLTAILFLQDVIARRPRLYRLLRYGFLTFTLLWLGWYAGAQLSVINVLTFSQSLLTEFRWELFLLEPLIFILWSYVAVAMLFWGRGVYCGWLCPFGALQELMNHGARRLGMPQAEVPFGLHERLWPVKYVIFLALFAVSLTSMAVAVRGAEVEPFKTAIALKFLREWPFVVYAGALLAAGLFVERFFCRYLCPLGGALAIPARLRMFDWLKRRRECGAPCQSCATDCTVQAIHPDGRINPNECIHCLNCQVLYFDDRRCPPLIERRKRRERRRALSSTGGPEAIEAAHSPPGEPGGHP